MYKYGDKALTGGMESLHGLGNKREIGGAISFVSGGDGSTGDASVDVNGGPVYKYMGMWIWRQRLLL